MAAAPAAAVARAAQLGVLLDGVDGTEENEKAAMTLVQKNLVYTRRQLKLDGSHATKAAPASFVLKGASSLAAAPPEKLPHCLEAAEAAQATGLPGTVESQAELQVLSALGISSGVRLCHRAAGGRQSALLREALPAATVEQQNRLTVLLSFVWVFLAAGLVVWSVFSVVRVPSRNAEPDAKIDLANDEKAWSHGFFTWISLSWADNLMGRYGKCWTTDVGENEVSWDKNARQGAYEPHVRFSKEWQHEIKTQGLAKASLIRAVIRMLGWKACAALAFACSLDVFMSMVGMVIVLEKFLNDLVAMSDYEREHPNEPQSYLEPSLIIFLGIFLVPMVYRTSAILLTLLEGYYTQVCAAGLASTVFEKALALPAGSAPEKELSEDEDPYGNMNPNVVQIVNVDIIACWQGLLRSMIMLVLSPILIVIMFCMLISRIHLAGFLGILYCIPATLLTLCIARVNLGFWMAQQGWQDGRLKKLTETITHIRTLKSLALETLSFEKLNKARHAELDNMQRGTIAGGVTVAIASSIPWGCVLVALYCLLWQSGSILVVQILIVQRLMGSLLLAIGILNGCIHKFIAVPNSFARIKKYLSQPNRPSDLVRPPSTCDGALAVQLNGSFSFLPGGAPALKDLDVTIDKGELVAVVGSVASGKSALLQVVLGELYPTSSKAFVVAPDMSSGRIAYCSQVPWIFEGTLRENVVLKSDFDHTRYFQALYAASLTADLEILPGGDMVTIGSYGIRLSGGQRARVALARAVYSQRAQLVIIDDPFASVDVGTGQHLFQELLLGPSMRDRTRIVATQPHAGRLRQFDKVLLLEDGRMAAFGTPEEVLGTEAFARLQEQDGKERAEGSLRHKAQDTTWTFGAEAVARVCEKKAGEKGTELRDVEDQDHITWDTMKWWCRSAGYHNLLLFFSCIFIARMVDLFQTVILATWMNMKMYGDVNDRWFMQQIIFRTLLSMSLNVFTMYAASRVAVSASKAIHQTIVHALLRAPIDRFFDKQPIGRLINRFSADMRVADDAVPWVLSSMLSFSLTFLITEAFILKVLPWRVVLCALPFFAVAIFYVYIYRGTAVPLIFASKFAMSRVHDLQAVCLTSAVSIRANGMFDDFINRFNEQSATVIKCQYLTAHVCVAWVQSRIFLCLSVLTAGFALCGLWGRMPIGTLSIIIVLSNNQMGQFEGLSQLLTNALNILNALQRLARYRFIPQEPPNEMASDPCVRVYARVSHTGVQRLEVRLAKADAADSSPTCVFLEGESSPLLRVCPVSKSLIIERGRRLTEWAPECEALRDVGDCYHITAVNGVSKDPKLMVEELCNPPSSIWLELWRSTYIAGLGVDFEKVTAGYCNEKAVLHSVSFSIAPRTKVGLAGPTGCGKSTTLLCLLRILEARSGRVLVGGLPISDIGLRLLRTVVGLVPQDATIFEGTWRYNIDPFNEFPDGRVWEALRCAHLLPFVRSLPAGVDSLITSDGANLSFGQKQLLSMARMVIRQPPVLLLDECTSALDPVTQKTVQSTVINAFPMSTVISIAHRVETLLDFDRVMVFDRGTVAEDGTLEEVLGIQNGIFAGMVKASKDI